jgi:hypothetical protein
MDPTDIIQSQADAARGILQEFAPKRRWVSCCWMRRGSPRSSGLPRLLRAITEASREIVSDT